MSTPLAILDIGSNSVRYALLDRRDDGAFFVPGGRKEVWTTRLGKGLDETGRLSPVPMADTIQACRTFCDKAQAAGARAYAYATSAVRDALNRQELLDALKDVCPDMQVFLLSGEEEGRLAYAGAMGGQAGTLLDIGGGSAQVVTPHWAVSFPTGCVRAQDLCPEDALERMRDVIYTWLNGRVSLPGPASSPFVGVGGTITTLGALLLQQSRYDGSQLSALRITPELLNALLMRLSALGDERRAQMPLLVRRHDVILQGGLILSWFMETLHIKALSPTDQGGMEGFAMWLYEKGIID
jgi:exopolyphosphatase/guanosine-5'-triphosphate,3'-diphosphate pyrophosphatase